MVGQPNECPMVIGSVSTVGLVDTGSMITTLSKSFYGKHLEDEYILHPLEELSVEVGGGYQLDYLGYVDIDLTVPENVCGATRQFAFLALVVPDTPYNSIVPICVGTNVIKQCRDMCHKDFGPRFLQRVRLPTAWEVAFRTLSFSVRVDVSVPVKTTQNMVIGPEQQVVIHGFCRVQNFPQSNWLVDTSIDHCLPGGLILQPILLKHDFGLTRVPVCVSNLGVKTVIIPARTVIAELQSVCILPKHSVPEPVQGSKDADAICMQNSSLGDIQFDVGSLDEGQRARADEFLRKWRQVFSVGREDIGHTDLVKHTIQLNDDTPFKDRHRRIPQGMYEEVRQHIQEMLDMGVIRESSSPWSSNVVCAKKKDGSLRLCMDYRKLNARTIKDAYPLPRIQDTLDSLSGATLFSTLDLRSGYWQVEMAEEDKSKTAFTIDRMGLFECNRMPFGLTNAPSTFQRLIERVLKGMLSKDCCVYINDIVIFSSTFEEHLSKLKRYFVVCMRMACG